MAESAVEPYCWFCEEPGHSVFNCPDRQEWHRETRDPDAALRLDPVVDYDPDDDPAADPAGVDEP